jgi:hypothetical protein
MKWFAHTLPAVQKYNRNGVILHEDDLRVVIATGLKTKSANAKTGDMIQIWILHRTLNPLDAIASGEDESICGMCPHRGGMDVVSDETYQWSPFGPALFQAIQKTKRRCYVQVDKAPRGIWLAYTNGRYRKVDASEYPALFTGRKVRLGAYGDPAFIPLSIIRAIVAICVDWTGYTHQWMDAQYAPYASYVMASADSEHDHARATALGWRTFRVRPKGGRILPGEIICPASDEGGYRSTCARCKLCNGTKYGASDPRKNIVIIDHSRIAASQPLIQIGL